MSQSLSSSRPLRSRFFTLARWLLVGGAVALMAGAGCVDETSEPSSNSSSAGAGAAPPTPMPLTVCNWNVFNLVDDKNDGEPFEDVDPNYVSHRGAVGAVLADIDADIIVLSEIEHQGAVDQLNELELGSAYPYRAIVDGNDPRGIDVAVLSKIELTGATTHKDDTFTKVGTQGPFHEYARDALEVRLNFNGRNIVIFAVHFKSKDNDNPDKRLAEAQHTRALADEILAASPETGVIIAGDFNDTPGSTPYTWVIDGGWGNAATLAPPADQWTYTYLGNQELVDHQMSSPVLLGMLRNDSVIIRHGADVDAASDHAPVVATYDVF